MLNVVSAPIQSGKKLLAALILSVVFISACSDNSENQNTSSSNSDLEAKAGKFGLTAWEYENGVGPIKQKLNIGNGIDEVMAKSGEQIFETKCMACHKIDERYVGPALKGVVERRTPEYVMNMILDPADMTQKHPEAKKMLAQYATQMTFQNVSQEDARKILEYLRSVSK